MVPQSSSAAFPQISYQHGTVMLRDDVPSRESDELILGILYGAGGYVASLPDYLGLGDSPGVHPYCHAKSEATATVDLLRAARALCDMKNTQLNEQLFLFGYSQGGHATMAATREIQVFHRDEFIITASAPMSGPYDLSGAQTDVVLSDDAYAAPFYLPCLMFAYNEIYDMYASPSDFLQSPYDTLLPPLFDGYHDSGEIDAVMPAVPNDIVKPEVLDDFINNPNNPFRLALVDNDLTDWAPAYPLTMYYCTGDDLVSYLNTINAYNSFIANGSTTAATYQPDTDASHEECAEPCFIFSRIWFDGLKEE